MFSPSPLTGWRMLYYIDIIIVVIEGRDGFRFFSKEKQNGRYGTSTVIIILLDKRNASISGGLVCRNVRYGISSDDGYYHRTAQKVCKGFSRVPP